MFHSLQGALCLQNVTWQLEDLNSFPYCSVLRPPAFSGLVMSDPLTSFDKE